MDKERNINVTLTSSENDSENSIVISIHTIMIVIKKLFLTWLVVTAVVGMFLSGIIMMMRKDVSSGTVTSLINFDYDGIENGLAPDGSKFDVSKIKSPNVIESALSKLGISLSFVESVRSNVAVKGIVPNDAKDKFNIYSSYLNGMSDINTVDRIIEASNNPTHYIISLNYSKAGFEVSDGKQILDEILNSYQEYFFMTYGYNESLGNSIVAIDYTEYDYPAAIDVFDSTLKNLEEYVHRLSLEKPDFRSGRTGYSLEDLKDKIETIKTADLDTLASYVTVNNVTNDKTLLLNYYQYKIDELKRTLNVSKSEFETISNSIENYEKDSMVIMSQDIDEDYIMNEDEENSENNNNNKFSILSEKYDELIKNKISKQYEMARYKEKIDYYDNRITALKNNKGSVTDKNRAETETRLANLNIKINNLINIVNKTIDEYYETVTFAHAYNILVPALGAEPWAETKEVLMPILIVEAGIFLIYIVVSFVGAIVVDTNKKRERLEKAKDIEE